LLSVKEKYLIKELKFGSVQAFEHIYNMYAAKLYSFCYSYTKSKETSEDIVQEVFIKLWNMREDIRQNETLKSLLFIMIKHRALNAMAMMINSPKFEDYLNFKDNIVDGGSHYDIEYNEFLSQVRSAMKNLPPTQRLVVELSRLQFLSNKEISVKLGLSEQTVKNNLSQGLKYLRTKLKLRFTLLLIVNYVS
jgi:RNA polymerase sigma-70 factor (ECF subfamily)